MAQARRLVDFVASPDEATGRVRDAAQLVHLEDGKLAEHAVGHQRLVAVGRVLEVPGQRVGRRQPVKVPDVPSLCAVADEHEEVEVGPGVEPSGFAAHGTQGQQGERIIATRQFPGQ